MADDVQRRGADGAIPMPYRAAQSFVTTSWDDGHIYDFAIANLLEGILTTRDVLRCTAQL